MKLEGLWCYRRILQLGLASFLLQSLVVVSLNHEGMALLRFKDRIENDPFGALLTWKQSSLESHPCSWYGVDCVDGHVVSLKLKDLCLTGTLAPELGHLTHIKLIVLRNNSLSGSVPEELTGLKELEVLDLGFNNFGGTLPHDWGNNVAVLLLDNNGQFCHISHEVEQLMMISEVQVEENDLSAIHEDSSYNVKFKWSCAAEHAKALSHSFMRRCDHQTKDPVHRRELQDGSAVGKGDSPPPPIPTVLPPDGGEPIPPAPAAPPPAPAAPPPASAAAPPPPPPPRTRTTTTTSSSETPPPSSSSSHANTTNRPTIIIASAASVGALVLLALLVALIIWRRKKIATVGPWRTGMSGRIQRSSANGDDKNEILSRGITDTGPNQGTPILKRPELEAACEEFSNVIGSSSIGKLYKGTLSTGAEIAVLSYAVNHKKDWSNDMQTLFREKVDKLSKVSHKNFLNLLGYCEEDKPFTRMLVFEYAPCGTLFEHLHVRESEHLDWTNRLRIMMGITYCLEHMHALNPSATHEDLTAYAVNLSEDYAAKLSDFGIWNEVALAARPMPTTTTTTDSSETKPGDNVYSFGLVLLEMMTGKTPHSTSTSSLSGWALEYLRGERPLNEYVDPMLRHFDADQLETIGEVIKTCVLTDSNGRPTMADLSLRLEEITGILPEKAAPRMSLW